MALPRAKKSFGQNFLIDESVVHRIVAAAQLAPGDRVLEIGPGTGALTQALVDAGAIIFAVEADEDLLPGLEEQFGDRIALLHGDVLGGVLRQPFLQKQLEDRQFSLIANIPYNITSSILETFLARGPFPSQLLLMVQREVADRVTASPPDMSVLSVMCQLYADCTRVMTVKAGAFRPIPKVDSAVIRCVRKSESFFAKENPEQVLSLVKAAFSSRRKQAHHTILPFAKRFRPEMTNRDVQDVLVSVGLPADVRPQMISVADWIRLFHLFSTE